MDTDANMDNAVEALKSGRLSDSILRILENGTAGFLVDRIISEQCAKGITIEDSIDSVLDYLVAAAEWDLSCTLLLMMQLRQRAGNVIGLHEVYDHIALWVYDDQPLLGRSSILKSPSFLALDPSIRAELEDVLARREKVV